MSETTRYLLASTGIPATEETIAAIEATGRPYEVCNILAYYAQQEKAKQAASRHYEELLKDLGQVPRTRLMYGEWLPELPPKKG